MARFRHNQLNIVVEPVYQRDGLSVERVRRFDQTALLPDIEHWRAWSLRVTLNGTRYSSHSGHAYTLAPNTILWHSPLKEVVENARLPGTGSDAVVVLSVHRPALVPSLSISTRHFVHITPSCWGASQATSWWSSSWPRRSCRARAAPVCGAGRH